MAVDSISLMAQSAYSEIQNRPKIVVNDEIQIQKAENFQNMVHKQFNSFAAMSPDQILNHIKSSRNAVAINVASNNGFAGAIINETVGATRSVLKKQEEVVRKSLIDEASLVDVLTATTEASNTVKTLVEVRNKFIDAFDKVMNMTM